MLTSLNLFPVLVNFGIVILKSCIPSTIRRWIYNLIHGYGLGLLGQTLAGEYQMPSLSTMFTKFDVLFTVVNVGLGTLVYDYAVGSTVKLYWLYIAFITVFIMINAGFTIAYFWKNRSKG